jgi:hypothetical protein
MVSEVVSAAGDAARRFSIDDWRAVVQQIAD